MLTGTGAHPPAHHTQTHANARTHTHTHTRLLLNAPQIDCTAAEADPSKLCLVIEVKGRKMRSKTSPLAGAAALTDNGTRPRMLCGTCDLVIPIFDCGCNFEFGGW